MKTYSGFAIVFTLIALVAGGVISSGKANPAGPSGYQVSKTVPLPGDGFWDYVGVDSDARRIYVSHGTKVLVVHTLRIWNFPHHREGVGVHNEYLSTVRHVHPPCVAIDSHIIPKSVSRQWNRF
jgi:hypothetical protein